MRVSSDLHSPTKKRYAMSHPAEEMRDNDTFRLRCQRRLNRLDRDIEIRSDIRKHWMRFDPVDCVENGPAHVRGQHHIGPRSDIQGT